MADNSPWSIFASGQGAIPANITTTARPQAEYGVVNPVGAKVSAATQDLMLRVAEPVQKFFSTFDRVLTTGELLVDPDSPLYKSQKYGKGFQPLSDISAAWERSKDVSFAQAFWKAQGSTSGPLGAIVRDPFGFLPEKPYTHALKSIHGPDLRKVNLWSDASINENFKENAIGSWLTGITDFAEQMIVGDKVAAGIVSGAKIIKVASGFGKKISEVADLAQAEARIDDHILRISNAVDEAGNPVGNLTVIGSDVETLAKNTNPYIINNVLSKWTMNDRMAPLIAKTDNPEIVRDLLLADKGYLPAMERLAQRAPADLWAVDDTSSYLAANSIVTGKAPEIPDDAWGRVIAAYDDAITRSPAHKQIYDAFVDPQSHKGIMQGTDWLPAEPTIGRETFIAARTRAQEIGAAATARDFSKVGGVTQTLIGGGLGRPVTALIRLVGTQLPRGMVSFSGAKINDGLMELKAHLDSLPALNGAFGNTNIVTKVGFANGERVIEESMSAADYRTFWLTKFMNAEDDLKRVAVLDEFDEVYGHHLGFTLGFDDTAEIDRLRSGAHSEIIKRHNRIGKDGMAIDYDGVRIMVDPISQRQFVESRTMYPWIDVERALVRQLKAAKIETGALAGAKKVAAFYAGPTYGLGPEVIRNTISSLNHGINASFLLRPGYVGKNSILEPTIAATLSHGVSFIADNASTAIRNAISNTQKRLIAAAGRGKNAAELASVNTYFENMSSALKTAIHQRDMVSQEYARLFNGDLPPSFSEFQREAIQTDLRKAEKLVATLEESIGRAAKEYRVKAAEIPSVYELRRRVEFLESLPEGKVQYGAQIANAKAALQGSSLTAALDDSMAKAYRGIDNAIKNLGEATRTKYAAYAKHEASKHMQYGDEVPMVDAIIAGEHVRYPGLFHENAYGAAMREATSNSATQQLNFLREQNVSQFHRSISRLTPNEIIDVGDQRYFEELAYIANRLVRGDKVQDMVLAGASRSDLYAFAASKQGKAYIASFPNGRTALENGPQGIKAFMDQKYDFTRRYFPDPVVRKTILNREVNANDLATAFANRLDEMHPIMPQEIDYPVAIAGRAAVTTMIDQGLANAFQFLGKFENPIRWAWAQDEFPKNVNRRLELLAQQGVNIDASTVQMVRSAAGKEMVKELSKTFYTIDRNNRALYLARAIAAFPTAAVSGMYRYTRLFARRPALASGFLRNYYNFYNTFGVDEYGNPVEDPKEAKYLVIPGTKEMGFGDGKGLTFSAKSFGFLANMPGPSAVAVWSMGKILQGKPDNEALLREVINGTVGNIPGMSFESMFPYGLGSRGENIWESNLVPTHVKSAARWLFGDDSDVEFVRTHRTIHNYLMTMYEMGEGSKPTLQQELKMTSNFFAKKFLWQFLSPMSPKISAPGQMYQDMRNLLLDKHNGDADLAEQEMLARMGDGFPTDRWFYTGSTKEVRIPASVEAYKNVWKDSPELSRKLASVDPSLLALMAYNVNDEQDAVMLNFLAGKDTTLPDGRRLTDAPMTNEKYERSLAISRGYDQLTYVREVATMMAKAKDPNALSYADVPEANAAYTAGRDAIKASNPDFAIQLNLDETGDNAFKYSQALYDIVSDKKFMSKHGKETYFDQAKFFIDMREMFVDRYKSAPVGEKGNVKDQWVMSLKMTAGMWDPSLQKIIDRYFLYDNMKGVVRG